MVSFDEVEEVEARWGGESRRRGEKQFLFLLLLFLSCFSSFFRSLFSRKARTRRALRSLDKKIESKTHPRGVHEPHSFFFFISSPASDWRFCFLLLQLARPLCRRSERGEALRETRRLLWRTRGGQAKRSELLVLRQRARGEEKEQ